MIVGLTGRIPSAKTEVAKVCEKKGAIIMSGDELGKKVVEKNPVVLKKLVKIFGKEILNSKAKVNRKTLGAIAFPNEKNKDKLNRIVHPYLLRELKHEITKFRKTRNKKQVLLVDAALIVEWKLYKNLDKLILVISPEGKRLARLRKLGFSKKEASDRIKRQVTDSRRRRYSDFVISNNGSLKQLKDKAQVVWKEGVSG